MIDESAPETHHLALAALEPDATANRCIAIIAKSKLIPAETITRASTFDSLAIDSLDKINISFEIEDSFNIQIPDDSISSLKTVGDIIDGVIRLQNEALSQPAAAKI